MKIEEWIGENNKITQPINFIKNNPDEIYELLVHYDQKCRHYKQKYEQIKMESKMFCGVILIALLCLLWIRYNEGLV
jgi:Na+/H+ antiporter NhaB